MRLFILAITVFISMNSLSAKEQLSCSVFSGPGELLGDYKISLIKSDAGLIEGIEVLKQDYYSDSMIYSKSSNQFLGNRISLEVPAFNSFESWKKECSQSPLIIKKCSEADYAQALEKYKNSPKWFLYPYQIAESNPLYFVEKSYLIKRETLISKLNFSEEVGDFKIYESSEKVEVNSFLDMNNSIDSNRELSLKILKGKVVFYDNALSYSLKIIRDSQLKDISVLTTSVTCSKN